MSDDAACLGIVTGLASEAFVAGAGAGKGARVRCAGAHASRAAEHARALIDAGCEALLSFGIAGGLDPAHAPGSVIVAESVVYSDGERLQAHAPWADSLCAVTAARRATLAASDHPVLGVQDKARLFNETGAACVDMETGAVARVAHDARLPWLALRCVADPAGRALPPWLTEVVGADGRIRPQKALAGLIGRPHDFPQMIRIGADSRRAMAALRRVALLAPFRFGFG